MGARARHGREAAAEPRGGRRLHRVGLTALWAVAILAGLSMVGAIYQVFAVAGERAAFPAPGQLVEIGGERRLHLRTWGDEHDGVAVILDAGAAGFSSEFAWIGPMLGERMRVIAYDRPGLGWSEGVGDRSDARASATALHAALSHAGIEPPYVLAGHSMGGFSVRAFRDLYPREVAGLVFIDATHPDQFGDEEPGSAAFGVMAALSRIGLFQVLNPADAMMASLPPAERERAATVSAWPSGLDAAAAEMHAWASSADQVRSAARLGDLPLLVISAPDNPALPEWPQLQEQLASLSTASRHVIIDGSDHQSLTAERNDALLVSAEICAYVEGLAGRLEPNC
jgi:pimeloyl-ACP methyl ester carboxylesterase